MQHLADRRKNEAEDKAKIEHVAKRQLEEEEEEEECDSDRSQNSPSLLTEEEE